MTKHTQGPWHFVDYFDNAQKPIDILDTDEGLIALVQPCDDAVSYARLIASAPDLLAALKQAEKWLGKMIADGGHLNTVAPRHAVNTLEGVTAAIQKAT